MWIGFRIHFFKERIEVIKRPDIHVYPYHTLAYQKVLFMQTYGFEGFISLVIYHKTCMTVHVHINILFVHLLSV